MFQPKITLAPHELAPNRRADLDDEPFEFRASWDGRERNFVGQVVGQFCELMLFYALLEEPERGNFISAPIWLVQEGERAAPIYEPRTKIPTEHESVIRVLEMAANEGWGRLYFLDENLNIARNESARWRLFLAQSGWGEWGAVPDTYVNRALFRWDENTERARRLALLPPLETMTHVRDSLLQKESDAAFAREFALLRAQQRNQNCRPTSRGNYEQWTQILGWYLQAHFEPSGGERGHLQIIAYANAKLSAVLTDSWRFGGKRFALPSNAARFADWTRQYFAPQLDQRYLQRCTAAADWSHRALKVSAKAARPTQHERLEALLKLRDWLADKATPAEIEALLRAD